MHSLPTLGGSASYGTGIRAAGQLVGWGYHNGLLRAFRLGPVGD